MSYLRFTLLAVVISVPFCFAGISRAESISAAVAKDESVKVKVGKRTVTLAGIAKRVSGTCRANRLRDDLSALTKNKKLVFHRERKANRATGYVSLPNRKDVGLTLLTQGSVDILGGRFTKKGQYLAARNKARKLELGIWNVCGQRVPGGSAAPPAPAQSRTEGRSGSAVGLNMVPRVDDVSSGGRSTEPSVPASPTSPSVSPRGTCAGGSAPPAVIGTQSTSTSPSGGPSLPPSSFLECSYNTGDVASFSGMQDIYVSTSGNDARSGSSPENAICTLGEVSRRIEQDASKEAADRFTPQEGDHPLAHGYRVRFLESTRSYGFGCGGTPTADRENVYWRNIHGTATAPIVFEPYSSDPGRLSDPSRVSLPGFDIADSSYIYFSRVRVDGVVGNDVIHCARCDHLMIRDSVLRGPVPTAGVYASPAQEVLKINQSKNIYIQRNDISGAAYFGIDAVGTVNGNIMANRIHDTGNWCGYLKGGSAHIDVVGNEFFNCVDGGFSIGNAQQFNFMLRPYLFYDASDIKFYNNVVHQITGAGVGVWGAYDALVANNTFYEVGSTSHTVEIAFAHRSCGLTTPEDGPYVATACARNLAVGAWGTNEILDDSIGEYVHIPNKHVYVYNNLIYNTAGTRDQLNIPAAFDGPHQAGTNIPRPASADTDLRIRGNVFWNPGARIAAGEEPEQGCATTPERTAAGWCTGPQLVSDNHFNDVGLGRPQLAAPDTDNFHPTASSNIGADLGMSIPDFPSWTDYPSLDSTVPETSRYTTPGLASNAISRNRDGDPRTNRPGAY